MAPKQGIPVIGYMRVSTDRQADEGTSLAAQKKQIEAYCNVYGLRVVAWIKDPGKSGKTLKRPGIQKALRMLDDGKAEGLIVAKLDRLTRSLKDLGALLERYFRDDKALLSVGEQVDTRSATGRMVLNVITTIAQWEREQIGERVASMHAEKRARRERVGKPPYGMRVGSDGRTLKPDRDEQSALKMIRTMRDGGESVRGIAEELNRKNIPSRGKKWHATTVARILAR